MSPRNTQRKCYTFNVKSYSNYKSKESKHRKLQQQRRCDANNPTNQSEQHPTNSFCNYITFRHSVYHHTQQHYQHHHLHKNMTSNNHAVFHIRRKNQRVNNSATNATNLY